VLRPVRTQIELVHGFAALVEDRHEKARSAAAAALQGETGRRRSHLPGHWPLVPEIRPALAASHRRSVASRM
jgi:hypothetical protein